MASMGAASATMRALVGSGPITRAEARTADGLTVFAPVWAVATVFSIAANPQFLLFQSSLERGIVNWICIAAAALVVARPRSTGLLGLLAGCVAARFLINSPVSSNNQTIAFFMNASILLVLAQAAVAAPPGERREASYARLRVVARALLAIMYFYGIFHKINTDFLNPDVSCATALYAPLTAPFGLSENIYGRYLAIASTFVVEAVALVALYWRRWFAIGLFLALAFHFVIPISAYSWYMDFSSLVLALYVLAIPPEVGRAAYGRFTALSDALGQRFGRVAPVLPVIALAALVGCLAFVLLRLYPDEPLRYVYRSVWILMWALFGGVAMIVLVAAAADHLPFHEGPTRRQPLWVYALPALLFVQSLSPYVGLKTETSIAMFSNLRTEGGATNHLLFPEPPYLFDYQRDVVEVLDSSTGSYARDRSWGDYRVMYTLHHWLFANPGEWITFRRGDQVFERVSAADLDPSDRPTWLERTFLMFKAVDYRQPKPCTH